MTIKLADARKSLERAKTSAQERLANLDQERRELKTSIKQIDAALRALGKTASGTSQHSTNVANEDDSAQAFDVRDVDVLGEDAIRAEN